MIANSPWRILFLRAILKHLPRYALDHAPISLNTEGGSDAGLRRFRFEAFWATDKRSFRVVKEAW